MWWCKVRYKVGTKRETMGLGGFSIVVVWAAMAEARGLSYPNAVAVGGRRMGKVRPRSLGRKTRWVIGALGSGTTCLPQHASPSVQKRCKLRH